MSDRNWMAILHPVTSSKLASMFSALSQYLDVFCGLSRLLQTRLTRRELARRAIGS